MNMSVWTFVSQQMVANGFPTLCIRYILFGIVPIPNQIFYSLKMFNFCPSYQNELYLKSRAKLVAFKAQWQKLCLLVFGNYPPASEAYWNQAQKNFTHPYTEYPLFGCWARQSTGGELSKWVANPLGPCQFCFVKMTST